MCFTLSAPSAYSSILPSPKLVNTSFAMFHCMPGDDLPVPASGDKHTLLFPESFFFFPRHVKLAPHSDRVQTLPYGWKLYTPFRLTCSVFATLILFS